MAAGRSGRASRGGVGGGRLKGQSSKRDAVDAVVARGVSARMRGEYGRAVEEFARAIALGGGGEVWEELAETHLECGDQAEGLAALRKALQAGGVGWETWVRAGQLEENAKEGVRMVEMGLQLLRTQKIAMAEDPAVTALKEAEVRVLCAKAELLLGLLESEQGKEAEMLDRETEKTLVEVVAVSEQGHVAEIECGLLVANVRLSQGRAQEAKLAMGRVWERVRGDVENVEKIKGERGEQLGQVMEQLGEMEMRIGVGKQLVEVGMAMEGVRMLETVMWECDYHAEVWYMMAVAWMEMGNMEEAGRAVGELRGVMARKDGYVGQVDEQQVQQLERHLAGDM